MPAKARLPRSAARAEVLSLPWRLRRPHVHPNALLVRLTPTRRSLALGLGILAFALGGYAVARESSLFAISRIEVEGGSPGVAGQVRRALASLDGRSLVGLDGAAVLRRVDAVPTVVRSSYDRAFPHTLRIAIVPERPAAVLRSGPHSWLVSVRGRVMERLPSGAVPQLPRIWLSGRIPVRVGAELTAPGTAATARAVALAGAFGARVATATDSGGVLVFHLKSGLELVLGGGGDVKLKVAVATQALAALPAGSTFLDVSVPSRPVAGAGDPGLAAAQGSSRG